VGRLRVCRPQEVARGAVQEPALSDCDPQLRDSVFPVRVSAWFFLGFWFLYQLYEANVGIFSSEANGGGVAFFAHVGGFVFGVLVARLYASSGRLQKNLQPTVGMPV
jgi:membrane associated rhomboid family serine protease